uniref:Uncharacterized protein n=1 Tax=Trypanosoma vivax (strain Y486) TaxID=1055687 RepID=G0TSR4_TRYVY|nr:hypothetical protein TVY486_0301790 [Trypanosoma vivax Y486]
MCPTICLCMFFYIPPLFFPLTSHASLSLSLCLCVCMCVWVRLSIVVDSRIQCCAATQPLTQFSNETVHLKVNLSLAPVVSHLFYAFDFISFLYIFSLSILHMIVSGLDSDSVLSAL